MRTFTGVVGAAMALLGGQASMAELQWTNTPMGAASSPAAFGSGSAFGGSRLPLYDEQRWSPPGALRVTPTLGNLGMAATVDIASVNPGADIERSACVSVAIRPGVAYECGDLRIAYNLPAIRVFNQSRAPALTYNSQHAKPTPIVRANVTAPSFGFFGGRPAIVQAILSVNGVVRAARSWSGGNWTSQGQLAISFDASDLPTNLYAYTLSVYFFYAGGLVDFQNATGELAIVNRSTSEFGRGWWVSGYEQIIALPSGNAFWVGGDGSTRKYVYQYDLNGRSVFKASTLSGVDSVTKDANGNWYRHLPRGAYVRFNSAGRHEVTVSELGRVTQFASWSCSRLHGIYLPVPPGQANLFWSFNYDVDGTPNACTTQAKYTGSAATNVANSPFYYRWTSRYIQPASGSFSYDNAGAVVAYSEANGRINTIQDVRGTTTRFGYDVGGLLDTAISPTGVGADSIRQYFRAGEGAALAAADYQSNMFTALYSLRPEITTPTKLYLGPWGNPLTITDPAGRTTSVLPDATFPLLAARVTNPAGWSQYALYTTDGKLRYMIADAVGGTGTPEWYYRYLDAAHPDNLTNSTDPAGVTTTFTYDSTVAGTRYPQLATQRTGSDPRATVSFFYCVAANCAGLPSSTTSGQDTLSRTATDTYEYDANGNLNATQSAGGKRTEHTSDAIGRVISTRTLVATTPSALWVTTATQYDALDRDSVMTTTAPASGAFASQQVNVRTRYDGATALVRSVRRTASDNSALGELTDSMSYDALGRIRERFAQGASRSAAEQFRYDAASNVTRRVAPRGDSTVMTYDALNRLTRRETFPFTYASRTPLSPNFTTPIPWKPLSALGATVVAGDIATFDYDDSGTATGALRTATNSHALTERTYLANGALQSECQSQRAVNGTVVTAHRMCVTSGYDVAQRRVLLITPAGNITYGYATSTGRLEGITGPTSQLILFGYDPRGQVSTLTRPGQIVEAMQYTLDGELERDAITWAGTPKMRDATLGYDLRGKMLTYINREQMRDTVTVTYSPMGHVASSRHIGYGVNYTGGSVQSDGLETMQHDALGNLQATSLRVATAAPGATPGTGASSTVTTPRTYNYYTDGSGRLRTTTEPGKLPAPSEFDASGNGIYSSPSTTSERADFYNGLGKLVASDARNTPSDPQGVLTFNEHRYDALGRRVWTRTRRLCNRGPGNPFEAYCDAGLVRRTVWDGAAELYEIQQPGNDDATDAEMESDGAVPNDPSGIRCRRPSDFTAPYDTDSCTLYGQVLYVHGQAVDAPLAVVRYNYRERQLINNTRTLVAFPTYTIYPRWSPLGVVDNASIDATISSVYCTSPPFVLRCHTRYQWPGSFTPYQQQALQMPGWRGTLVESKREFAGGLLYRRNRYIDAATGRFTQPDPIGLAGGLNSYGFASGDPVSFSDPFGLCPAKTMAEVPQCLGQTLAPAERFFNWYAGGLVAAAGGVALAEVGVSLAAAVAGAGPAIPRLSQDLANTFEEGRYTATKLVADMRVYRVFDGEGAGKIGRWFTTAAQGSSGTAQAALRLYNNNATRMVEAVIPKGTAVYMGPVAGSVNGSIQVFVPNAGQAVRFGAETILKP